jgi:hypothetical protein
MVRLTQTFSGSGPALVSWRGRPQESGEGVRYRSPYRTITTAADVLLLA